jgi:hypothetical protein
MGASDASRGNTVERQPQSISEVVAAALREMGLGTDEASVNRTILIRDGNFVGYKIRFDGGYALWLVEKGVVEVYADDGNMKTLNVETSDEKRAA